MRDWKSKKIRDWVSVRISVGENERKRVSEWENERLRIILLGATVKIQTKNIIFQTTKLTILNWIH
jgi:hypothetical protein